MIRHAQGRLALSLFRCNDKDVFRELRAAVGRGVDVEVLVTSRAKGGKKKLRKLWLTRNAGITDVAAVAKLPALEELHLEGVGAKSLAPLAGMKTLKKLTVSAGMDTGPVQTIDGIEIERR